MTANRLKIAQGGLVFGIRTEGRQAWITRDLARRWQPFVTDAAAVDVDVGITCYKPGKMYHWPENQLAPFKRLFHSVLGRFPFTPGGQGAPPPPDRILARLDPGHGTIREVTSQIRRGAEILFANTASGLFLFNPARKRLDIFSQIAPAPFPVLSRLYSKPSMRRSVLMADIANGVMLSFSWLLVKSGGLLLHGAGVSKSGTAVLFLGLSGAGKSTAARLCAADACFSDDGVIVKKNEDGFHLYPSAFTQSPDGWRQPLPVPMRLRKILLLKKSDENQVTPLDKNILMNDVLLHLIHFFRYFDRETARMAFENTRALVRSQPAYNCYFTKNREDWSEIWQAPEKRKSTNHRS